MGCDSPVFKCFKHWLYSGWRTQWWKCCWRDSADARKKRVKHFPGVPAFSPSRRLSLHGNIKSIVKNLKIPTWFLPALPTINLRWWQFGVILIWDFPLLSHLTKRTRREVMLKWMLLVLRLGILFLWKILAKLERGKMGIFSRLLSFTGFPHATTVMSTQLLLWQGKGGVSWGKVEVWGKCGALQSCSSGKQQPDGKTKKKGCHCTSPPGISELAVPPGLPTHVEWDFLLLPFLLHPAAVGHPPAFYVGSCMCSNCSVPIIGIGKAPCRLKLCAVTFRYIVVALETVTKESNLWFCSCPKGLPTLIVGQHRASWTY